MTVEASYLPKISILPSTLERNSDFIKISKVPNLFPIF